MLKVKTVLLILFVPVFLLGQASDLFISEYVEGSSNNKYLEIFNGTGSSVDLSNYDVVIYANGASSPTSTITITGTLANNDVFVIAHSSAVAWGGTPDLSTGSLTFNGNDAVALRKSSANIDVIGTIGDGTTFGADVTLRRQASVAGPTTTYNAGEWDSYAQDTVSDLGTHTFTPASTTTVQFSTSGANVNEGDGTYNLSVSITNEDGSNATTADVVLISGTAADINNYTTQQVNFPAGSAADQTVVITITDDGDLEGSETVTFELQNVSGGNSAAAGSPSQFGLTIIDNDTPPIIITEIMQNPNDVGDSAGEWFEIFNAGASTIDINGWQMKDNGTNAHTIDNGGALNIGPGEFLVLTNNTDSGTNGGFTGNYQFPSTFALGNGSDAIILFLSDGVTEVDRVEWDGGTNWPDPTGASMVFTGTSGDDNNDFNFWTTASTRESSYLNNGNSDVGSPGTNGSDQSLPVSLSSFTAKAGDSKVTLTWITESEVDNLGFILERSQSQNGEYQVIASYQSEEALQGAHSSNERNTYYWIDSHVFNGITYWYKLIDVDINGVRTEHPAISAMPNTHSVDIEIINGTQYPEKYNLRQNYPNPFNPNTTIQFDIPKLRTELTQINLSVFNLTGQKVRTLLDGPITSGSYQVVWNGLDDQRRQVPSGVYFYFIKTSDFYQSRKMILMK